jgi:hypothetical protein
MATTFFPSFWISDISPGVHLAQRLIFIIGGLVIAIMALFPPWIFVYKYPELPAMERPAGYHSLFGQHVPQDPTALAQLFGSHPVLAFVSLRIDATRLSVQIVAAIVLTAVLYSALRPRR